MASLTDNVREQLRLGKVKLWLPPYTPDVDGALSALAGSYAELLGTEADLVVATLEELRQHAIEKLRARTRVTLVGRVLGSVAAKPDGELRIEFDASELGSQVRQKLCDHLGTSKLKVIAGGKLLQDDSTLAQQGWEPDHDRKQQPLKVLFMASGPPRREVAASTDTSGEAANPADAASSQSHTPVLTAAADEGPANAEVEDIPGFSVAQVREAAEMLTEEGFGDFELADAKTGRLVPVPPAARQALISAIALHARGKEILSSRGEKAAVQALEFLAEADRCFERCRQCGAETLLEQLSNFGQLQLDICWAYAILGDTDCLPDAETRLNAAERMIDRQVDSNFLKIAEVHAEQGRMLPPEVLPSVRLWLLRGVAKQCRGDPESRGDLQRAAIFMQGLRVNEDAIGNLLALGATRMQAVAALRRCGGSPDNAATELLSGAAQREAARKERDAQRKFGNTAGGDFVDPSCVMQLTGMGFEEKLAVAALKQTNNDLSAALDAVQTQPRDVLLGGGKKPSNSPVVETPVDELSLATLMSMGFEQKAVEKALRTAAGNEEEALVALTAEQACSKPSSVENLEATPEQSVPVPAPTTADTSTAESEQADNAANEAHAAAHAEAHARAVAEAQAAAEAKAAEETAKRRRLDAARDVIERELGRCLRRGDVDDEVAGTTLEEEEALLQQYLSRF